MKTSEMPVIELAGSPRERGRIYGRLVKTLIAEVMENWQAGLGNFLKREAKPDAVDADAYIDAFLAASNYLDAIERWAPEILEEVKGIAEGSGQSYKNTLALQFGDEEWIYGLRRGLDKPTNKCTAFGVPDQLKGISYAGQNMDVPTWVDNRQVLLRIMPTESSPEALVFSKAGNIGLNGMNASGLGITCNTLAQLSYATDGLPVGFIVRTVLTMHNIDEAEKFLRTIKHASGQNFILSSAGDMRCFECCGTSVVRYQPEALQGRVFHSNHPLVNNDEITLVPPERVRSKTSLARFDSICTRLGDVSKQLTIDDVKAALAAHDDPDYPVSCNINRDGSSMGFTAGASIYEFDDIPRLHLAAGPPCITDFKAFEFKTHQA